MIAKKVSEPINEPVNDNLSLSLQARLNFFKKLYSTPKIYRFTELVEGKNRPSIKKQWHVYYYFRSSFFEYY